MAEEDQVSSVNEEKNLGDTSADRKTEQGWQPIEDADPDIEALLFAPARRLWIHPEGKPAEFRVAKPRDYTWATHFMSLPDPPEAKD